MENTLVHSSMLIDKIIKEKGKDFGFIQSVNPLFLENCHQTSFSWTKNSNSICLAMGKDYLKMAMDNPNVQGIITSPKVIARENIDIPKAFLILDLPDQFFYYLHNCKIHEQFHVPKFVPYIDPSAQISPRAIVSPQVYIGAGTVIHDGAIVLDNSIIGNNCTIFHNVTIGSIGFFSKHVLGNKIQIQHFGGVKLGENCIVHTGCNISRSVNFSEYTQLGNNTHVGIHTNIAHDCQIGENCDISSKVCLAGRVKIGDNVWIGASATISNNIFIDHNANIKIGSVVISDVLKGDVVSGNFAVNHRKNMRVFLSNAKDANT